MQTRLREPAVAGSADDGSALLQLPEFDHGQPAPPQCRGSSFDMNSCLSFSEHGVPWLPGRLRYHQDFELHAIGAPFARAFVGDELHSFMPGTVVLIGPRLPHNFQFSGPADDAGAAMNPVLRFAEAPLRSSMALLPDLREAEALLDRARQGVEFVGFREAAAHYLTRIAQSRGLERFAAFAALLHELARWKDTRVLTRLNYEQAQPLAHCRWGKIYAVLDYLRTNYMQEFSLPEVSAMFGMQEAALSRQFRKLTGSTFTSFVTELRVTRACQLLLHGDRQISAICYAVGFNNISNFNRQFLKRKGLTPTEYRALADPKRRRGDACGTPAAAGRGEPTRPPPHTA
ncbi:AraC-like DNA-binding protein [Variovorax sp. 1140]|uniref:helix-turn-helix domain-containing protein n=1 Tax=Variovorax atrisoli TaxID=3394203 RepID=UPI00339A9D59